MITVTWIAVECWHEYIAREGPAKFLENIFIPVVLNVGKLNTMPLLQVAKSPRRRDILKITATVIAKHPLGQKRFEVRITQPHIDIQPTIVVQVPKIPSHVCDAATQTGSFRHIRKRSIVVVVEEVRNRCVIRLVQNEGPGVFLRRGRISASKNVQPAVIIVIKKPRRKRMPHSPEPCLFSHVGEYPFAGFGMLRITWSIIAKQVALAKHGREIQIGPAVIVVVAPGNAFHES